MVVLKEILEKERVKFKSIDVQKHLDVDIDVGTLCVLDPNVLDVRSLNRNKDDYLLRITRENVQLLFNRIWDLPTDRVEEAIVAKLPPSKFNLPRSKPVPKPRPLTKWEQFAKDKGIHKKKKSKLTWDDELKKWIPRYGLKKVQAHLEKDWVLEVPANADPNEDQFAKKNEAKGERIAKNELQRLRNVAKAKNVKIPRFGILDGSSSKDLQAAITIAKASTASVGKFQDKLPKEKEARGIATITPGAPSRKRKLPPVSAEEEKTANLTIANSVLNKKPKLDIEKAVSKHIHVNQSTSNLDDDFPTKKAKELRKKKAPKSAKGRKPRGAGVERKGKGGPKGGGRKRR